MTRDFLLRLVEGVPSLTMHGVDGPYLTRYYLRDEADGGKVVIHQFHRSDEDEELHSHPWEGESLILLGSYDEERRGPNHTVFKSFHPGDVNVLTANTYHRIKLMTSEVWTLFRAGRKVQDWGFWNKQTQKETPWREFLHQKGLIPHP